MKSRFSHRTRLLSLLLTAVMVFTFLPTAAFADSKIPITEVTLQVKSVNEGGWGGEYVSDIRYANLIRLTEFEPIAADQDKYEVIILRWEILENGSYQELHYLENERISAKESYRILLRILPKSGYEVSNIKYALSPYCGDSAHVTIQRGNQDLGIAYCYISPWELDCKHEYTWDTIEEKEPTCTESGNILHYCCRKCGKLFVRLYDEAGYANGIKDMERNEVVTPPQHDEGWVPSTDDGLHVWGCRKCDYRVMSKVGQCQYDDPADDTCNLCGRVRSCGLDLISVEITEPENGDTPDTAPKKDELSDIDFYTADAQWTTESGESVESFQEGEKYLCHFTFRASDTKVPFRNDIKISINGDILGTEGFADHLKLDSQTENEIKVTAAFTATHKHHYAAKWEKDAFYHWHECSCGAKKDRQMHTFDEPGSENICTVCRATREDGTDPVDPGSSGDGSAGAGIAIAIGGVAVASGIGVYYIWLNHQLKAILPEGTAVPANRGDLAMLLWSNAGKPEPEDQPAFTDVADPELAKAAQWCVEAGKMTMRGENRFAPDRYVFRQVVLNALKS